MYFEINYWLFFFCTSNAVKNFCLCIGIMVFEVVILETVFDPKPSSSPHIVPSARMSDMVIVVLVVAL